MARVAKKNKVVLEEALDLPEFGYYTKDEFGVVLVIESNSGKDKHKYLEFGKKLERPFLVSIESDLFDSYKFKNYAMNIEEAKNLMKELTRMIDHVESK